MRPVMLIVTSVGMAKESLAVLKKKFAVTQEWRGTVLRYPFDHLGFRSPTADSVDRVLDARGEGNALQRTSRRSSVQKGICFIFVIGTLMN